MILRLLVSLITSHDPILCDCIYSCNSGSSRASRSHSLICLSADGIYLVLWWVNLNDSSKCYILETGSLASSQKLERDLVHLSAFIMVETCQSPLRHLNEWVGRIHYIHCPWFSLVRLLFLFPVQKFEIPWLFICVDSKTLVLSHRIFWAFKMNINLIYRP